MLHVLHYTGLSKRRRDDVTGDVTLHTRVNGRRRSPERNEDHVTNCVKFTFYVRQHYGL